MSQGMSVKLPARSRSGELSFCLGLSASQDLYVFLSCFLFVIFLYFCIFICLSFSSFCISVWACLPPHKIVTFPHPARQTHKIPHRCVRLRRAFCNVTPTDLLSPMNHFHFLNHTSRHVWRGLFLNIPHQ